MDILLTAQAPTTNTAEETATQKEQGFESGRPGEFPHTPKEDSHSTAGTTGNAWFHRQTWVKISSGVKCWALKTVNKKNWK